MNLQPLVAALTLTALTALAAPPRCSARLEALKQLVVTLDKARAAGPVELPFDGDASFWGRLEASDDWKRRGVRLVAGRGTAFGGDRKALSTALAKAARAGTLEVCELVEGAVARRYSLDADARVVAPLITLLSGVPRADRATVLAGETGETPFKCPGLQQTFSAAAHASPENRVPVLVQSTTGSLEACKCPTAEAERVYAVVTLIADVSADQLRCAPLVLAKPGQRIALEGPVTAFIEALGRAKTIDLE